MIPKFRAWHKKEKKMYEVVALLGLPTSKGENVVVVCLDKNLSDTEHMFKIDEIILIQSTGLKDRNGKEIFEGDILKLNTREPKWQGIVERYDSGLVVISDQKNLPYSASLIGRITFKGKDGIINREVIGNIHENPELLKELKA